MSLNSASGGYGSSTSRGGRQFEDNQNPRRCTCEIDGRRLRAVIMTSWTDENPGRRFYGCRNWKTKNCGFFDWLDEPISERGKEVINELKLMKIKDSSSSAPTDMEPKIVKLWDFVQALKSESSEIKKKVRLVTAMLLASWIMYPFVLEMKLKHILDYMF
ncbi:uncharacterized protein LOC130990858 [Salvia miltiorrhiza]|uniref:uncharacterized protein LOC130990858 n=1 Tax=Salvia miltiorrhiza TaxID=226208 RepID=UPI0025AC0C6A|nr:uncharacterized protein LOC130990858 [Salvia miltiorrhiza]